LSSIGLSFVLSYFSPELELLYENREIDLGRRIDFGFFAVIILMSFWLTYRRIRHEKSLRNAAATEKGNR